MALRRGGWQIGRISEDAMHHASDPAQPNPLLVWDTINAYQRSAALRAAIDLDLFTSIGSGAGTAEELAAPVGASPRGIRILCDYLSVIGFLTKAGDAYRLTLTSAVFLNGKSPACMASTARFLNSPKLMAGFANLTDTVRRGGTQLRTGGVNEPEFSEWVTFAESMTPLMLNSCTAIAGVCGQANGRGMRVLDVAAGHGLFGIAVAGRVKQAEITAQDWPGVLQVALRNARQAGIEDRYRLLPGNIFDVDLGDGYDVILLTNLLHHFDKASCTEILRKMHRALSDDGRLITLEFVPNEDRVSPPIAATFSLMMLGLTPAGDAYTAREHAEMLADAGFDTPAVLPVPQAPQTLLVSTKRVR
jgi:ubiquinone/menaquinone biosynthesis C-methylase UbiE